MINTIKSWKVPCITALLLVASAASHAYSCKKEDPPAIPASSDVTMEQLNILKQEIDSYMESAQRYIECKRHKKKINDTIDEMKQVAAEYNVLIVLYKERHGEEKTMQVSEK